jgi:DNA-binding response OmpR family regulator
VAIPRQNAMVFDQFRLDPDTESVWCEADEIRVRPKTFAVPRYLAEPPHRLVTKDERANALLQESLAIWRETGSNHAIAIGYRALSVDEAIA